jgi:DNA-binding MarR family transcriptional regulator
MNAVFFAAKRAFHGTLRVMRKALAKLGLTAARFDLLYAVREYGMMGAHQSAIRKDLGVSAPVVSRMLKSLEKLGLVVRERCPRDTRRWIVSLTRTGRKRIRTGIRRFIRSGKAQRVLDRALVGDRCSDDTECFWAMCRVEGDLNAIRRGFRDRARLHYPWHPDD